MTAGDKRPPLGPGYVDARDSWGVLVGDGGIQNNYFDARVTLLMCSPERPSVPGPLLSPRSAYLAQVRQIAPPALVGREAELQELARFCLEEQAGAYVWWRAGPWAGKSALLSTFVLNPPETVRSQVQVVAFFVTARLAAQDTRQAFTAVVGEQLAALTGQQVPAVIDESLREAWLLDLLDQAAGGCRQRGIRLVLLVDGLDEDRGVTTGPHARSIAALLPGVPPAGMRVIVAGRLNPPVPDDVPDWHPLRDQGIIRPLAYSPHARDLQRLGQTELKRLLTGSPVEQDLLGLLTAARGGLSSDDLHELTGAGLVEIEEVLHTVAGRTFTRRSPQGAAADGPLVYLLGHEELDAAARRYLGETRLADYRNRLHTWAESYSTPPDGSPPWPEHTPEYLLTGYPRVLASTRDATRLLALATDSARHDRTLNLSGGDSAALTEITNCQDLFLAHPEPDLYAMARLSLRRSALLDRNANIPVQLPAVWATLGQPARAEALARSLTRPDQQAQALTAVARAITAGGDTDRAKQIAAAAEHVACSITDRRRQARGLTAVAEAVAAAGDTDRAEQIARSLDGRDHQARALAMVAAVVGNIDHAEQMARSVTDRDEALTAVARAVAAAGDPDRAERIVRLLDHRYHQAEALTAVAEAIAAAGDTDRAERIARSITDPHDPDRQARALAAVAETAAIVGDTSRAERIAAAAEQIARSDQARTAVARAIAAGGDTDRAEQIARSFSNPNWQAQALTAVAETAAACGDTEHAKRFATAAEQVVRSITDRHQQARELTALAEAVAATGDTNRAEQIARSLSDPNRQAHALTAVAKATAATGNTDRTERVAEAPHMANSITDTDSALTAAAVRAAAAGDIDRAERLARLTDLNRQTWALTTVAKATAATGDTSRAEQIARSITDTDGQARALTSVAEIDGGIRSHRILASAFAVGHWTVPLRAVAKLHPRVVLQIADIVSGTALPRS
jgi:hypothetical protein